MNLLHFSLLLMCVLNVIHCERNVINLGHPAKNSTRNSANFKGTESKKSLKTAKENEHTTSPPRLLSEVSLFSKLVEFLGTIPR